MNVLDHRSKFQEALLPGLPKAPARNGDAAVAPPLRSENIGVVLEVDTLGPSGNLCCTTALRKDNYV